MTDDFVAELRSRSEIYWEKHPFQQDMLAGRLTPAQIRGFVANRYHDGPHDGEGGLADWLRLCDAVGLSREEVLDERHIIPGVRFAVDRYIEFCRSGHWTAGVASSLTELFAPDLMSQRIAAYRQHYPWIDSEGLAYFEKRCVQAPKEASFALDVVTTYCTTAEMKAAACDALTLKCDVLWSMLDAIDYAYRKDAAYRDPS